MNQHPMLAGKFDASKIVYPCAIQPKFDGIRCLTEVDVGYSRTLKPIPNEHIQTFFREHKHWLSGMDGELVVGSATAADVYRKSMSGIMSAGGKPDFTYHIFDMWDHNGDFEDRLRERDHLVASLLDAAPYATNWVEKVETFIVNNETELMEKEAHFVFEGYEGAIVRALKGKYKAGRSTSNQGFLLKLKRFIDDDAVIIGFEELLTNQNEATKDNLGHTARSSHKENKLPASTLGALRVKNKKGQEFKIGTGFDLALRLKIWNDRETYLNTIVKYKYVSVGGYELPRFPVFLGFRSAIDI